MAKKSIRILPPTAKSVQVTTFLEKWKVSLPKTRATEARAKAGSGKIGKGGGKASGTAGKAASKGVKGASRAARAFGAALPVVIETGFFFYHETNNRAAFERGEQTAEETQCITYENAGRHGAALALGTAGAWGGAEAGAAIGTGSAPGPGTAVGAVVGGVVGGIVGGIVGEIGGEKAGEWMYVSKAEKAAEAGDLAAVFFLGGYHYKRIKPGKDKHVREALEYLGRARIMGGGGYAKANVCLGMMAWDGTGQPGDKAKAMELWREAATLEDEDAMYLLARAMLAGEGTKQDIEEGHAMMREAASRGCELAIDEYPETEQLYLNWVAARERTAKRAKVVRTAVGPVLIAIVLFLVWLRVRRARRRTA